MKKVLLLAAMTLALMGCGKKSVAGIWGVDSDCPQAAKGVLVLNDDGTAKSMCMPFMAETWKQEGDKLILTGKQMPRCHKPGPRPDMKDGEVPPCCKDGEKPEMKEGGKPCCKEGKPEMKEGDKPCCKDGKPEMKEGEKPCCKDGEKPEMGPRHEGPHHKMRPEPKPFADTLTIKEVTAEKLVLVARCCKTGEETELVFKHLDEMPACEKADKPCCKEGKPEMQEGDKPCCKEGEEAPEAPAAE